MAVFISYSHKDQVFVDELIGQLRQAEIVFWYDAHILAGEQWAQSIDHAITNCSVCLLVLSTNALDSAYVQYEWSFALGADKEVIPIIIEPWENLKAKVHVRLDGIQGIDFSRSSKWDDLLTRLNHLIQQNAVTEVVRNAARALHHAHSANRRDAIKTLEYSDDPNAVEILADAAQMHPVLDVRIYAALALSNKTNCTDLRAVDGLNELLCENIASLEDRYAAVHALEEYSTERSAQGLLCALRDDTDQSPMISELQLELWYDAIRALSSRKSDLVREGLENVAASLFRPMEIRQRAADALKWVRSPLSIPMLTALLDDRNFDLRMVAANSLAAIGGPEVRQLLEDKKKKARGEEKSTLEHFIRKLKD